MEAVPAARLAAAEREAASLRDDLQRSRYWLERIQGSASWRLTEPLRAAKRRLRERA